MYTIPEDRFMSLWLYLSFNIQTKINVNIGKDKMANWELKNITQLMGGMQIWLFTGSLFKYRSCIFYLLSLK